MEEDIEIPKDPYTNEKDDSITEDQFESSESNNYICENSEITDIIIKVPKIYDMSEELSPDKYRHFSEPGKHRVKSKLGKHRKVSRSFGGYKSENKVVRRCSTPDYRAVRHPVLPIHHRGEKAVTCPPKSVLAGLLLAQQTVVPIISGELTPVPIPAPLVVEDPPSSDNATSEEETTVRHNIDPVLLNGSSGNFGCAGGRSAPSTPHGGTAGQPPPVLVPEPHSQPCSPSYTTAHQIPRSPSHIFGKYDKGAIKYLSNSEPLMTAQARSPEPPSPSPGKGDKVNKVPVSSSRARQKKFQKHFKVDHEEKVENYYSCALVGDILLQGHLYITKNYFAFYSNVFGYVTKLLIPLSIVREIAKEKTARIIPNAVGVYTTDAKHHTFGSLMSREATYQHMLQTKKRFDLNEEVLADDKISEVDIPIDQTSDTVESSSNSGNDSPTGLRRTTRVVPIITKVLPEKAGIDAPPLTKINLKTIDVNVRPDSFQKYNMFLLVSTLLLLLLFTSAGILLYRISRIQNRYALGIQESIGTPNNEIYNEILHWQSQLHTKSAGAVHNFLDNNLDQIAKVRKSLEALSTLLIPNNPSETQAQAPEHRSEVPPETNRIPEEVKVASASKSVS